MQSDHYSFIVRIWREGEDHPGDRAAWRGSIDDVSSNKRLYFNDLDGIRRFIEEQIGSLTQKSSLNWTRRFKDEVGNILSRLAKGLNPRQLRDRHEKR